MKVTLTGELGPYTMNLCAHATLQRAMSLAEPYLKRIRLDRLRVSDPSAYRRITGYPDKMDEIIVSQRSTLDVAPLHAKAVALSADWLASVITVGGLFHRIQTETPRETEQMELAL